MAKINLLPWRVEERERRNREFMVQMFGVVLLGLLGAFMLWSYFNSQLSSQRQANDLVTQANTALDRNLEEIKELEKTREDIVSRMKVIQDLQGTRPLPVHVFDSLVRVMPPTLYLTEARREGESLTLTGRADNPNTVSDFLRNLDLSPWMEDSVVSEISNDITTQSATNTPPQQGVPPESYVADAPEKKYIRFVLTTKLVNPKLNEEEATQPSGNEDNNAQPSSVG